MVESVNLQEMHQLVEKRGWVLVDVRESDWYNGWPSPHADQGGHIPGARNFDLEWMSAEQVYVDRLLDSKGINPSRGVVIYGKDDLDASTLAQWLITERDFDASLVRTYDEAFSVWLARGGEPASIPGYQKLVPPEWVEHQRMTNDRLKILDVSFGKGARYLLGHIPGALYVDTNDIESEPHWNIRAPEQLEKTLLNLGVAHDTPVVVYGDDMTAAARLVSVLEFAGVTDVRLLNGGWQAWSSTIYPVERGFNKPVKIPSFGAELPARTDIVVNTDSVEEMNADCDAFLVSVRSWPEFIGETSGYSYIEPKGRIPGAVWGQSGTDPHNMQDYLNPDNTLREPADIEGYWQLHNISKDNRVAFYCGTGWRASLAWFAASILGYEKAAVYDGGWYEWSSDPDRPIAEG